MLWRKPVVRESADLLAAGGARKLREPLRPLSPGPRVLLFGFDGVGEDELRQVLKDGRSRHMKALLGEKLGAGVYAHGYSVPGVLSILPSTTVAAWTSLYTGQPPAHTGVPGNEWFAREERRFYAPAPVSVHDKADTLRMLSDGLVGDAVKTPTVFEKADVRAFVSLAHVYRGADLFTTPAPDALASLAAEFAEGLVDDEDVDRVTYSEVDEQSATSVLAAIEKHGPPRLQVVYFPGVDLYTHVARDALAEQKRYVRDVLDSLVGRILDAYAARGALDDTYVVFVSDHGHTPVLHDERHALSTEGHDEPVALLERLGFRVRPRKLGLEAAEEDYQAVVAYQGAMAYVYLADRSTCASAGQRCDWSRPPRLEEDVLPVARAFFLASARGEGLPAMKGTLDLVFTREPRPAAEEDLPFQVFDGTGLVPLPEYLQAHPRPDLLRLRERMDWLSAGPHGDRAGDVLLLARSGLERPVEERYYFANRYRSWHGSPAAQDSRIPLIVAKRNEEGGRLQERVEALVGREPSQLSLTPLILDLLQVR
ncbi:alkaline phosphatase family protein [Corallococcus sp. 4LFB]|uniref:alkaline phosphatase family protein n=1 Tax=Corallococcus sp. 4LFB TaxID=3383249 RepID=UPI003974AAD6